MKNRKTLLAAIMGSAMMALPSAGIAQAVPPPGPPGSPAPGSSAQGALERPTAIPMQALSPNTMQPASTALGSKWSDVTKLPDFFAGNWQSVTSFLDREPKTPLTAKAKAYADAFKPITDIPFAGAGCKTPGMPTIQRLGSPLKFFFEPGMIAIYIENSSMTRFIKVNGKHAARPNPSYLGDSIGHFEGNEFVVESIAFADDILFQYTNFPGKGTSRFVLPIESVFGPHGPNLRMVERMKLLDPDTMEITLTIYDDTVWTKPYVANTQIFKRNRGDAGIPAEWVCGSGADPLEFDPVSNESIMQDPADVLKKLQAKDAK